MKKISAAIPNNGVIPSKFPPVIIVDDHDNEAPVVERHHIVMALPCTPLSPSAAAGSNRKKRPIDNENKSAASCPLPKKRNINDSGAFARIASPTLPKAAALTESNRKKRPLDNKTKSACPCPRPPRPIKKLKIDGGGGGAFVMIASPTSPTAALTESKRRKRPIGHESKSADPCPVPPLPKKKQKIDDDGGAFVMIAKPTLPAAAATPIPSPLSEVPKAEQVDVVEEEEEEIEDGDWISEFAKELCQGVPAVELLVEKPAEMLRNPSWKSKSFHC